MEKIRKIQIYPEYTKLHTAYKIIFSNPPKGYKFIDSPKSFKSGALSKLKSNNLVKMFYHFFISKFKTTIIFNWAAKSKESFGSDLIFSRNHLYHGNKNWVLYILENAYCLTGFNYPLFLKNKKNIEKILKKENCKKIICANESSIDVLKKHFGKEVIKKTRLIRPAITPMPFKEKRGKKPLKILFMGSINNPQDFYHKGGLEALEAFEQIQEKYDVELIVRCKVDEKFKQKVKNNKKIKIMEEQVPFQEIVNLYSSSDILLLPARTYMLMAFLESMYFGLPIIALNTYAVKDYLKDGDNALLVEKPEWITSQIVHDKPMGERNTIKEADKILADKLAEKLQILIKDPKLREKMGKNGQKTIQEKFSVERMKNQLKEIFDQAISPKSN